MTFLIVEEASKEVLLHLVCSQEFPWDQQK